MAQTPTGIIAWNFPVPASHHPNVIRFHVWWQLKCPNTEVVTEATRAPVCRGHRVSPALENSTGEEIHYMVRDEHMTLVDVTDRYHYS